MRARYRDNVSYNALGPLCFATARGSSRHHPTPLTLAQRTNAKKASSSAANSSGCSQAGKWPPRSGSLQ